MQMTLEMLYKDRFYIDKPVRLIELFCGIGAFSKALTRLGVEFETYRAIDFDKYKIQGFNAIHGANFDTTDITELRGEDLEIVDTEKYCYVMSYSYPCQDLSMAGKRQGMAKGSGTRSGLLWEVERLLTETEHLPQVLIMENVPEVRRGINKEHFSDWVRFLESLGYTSYAEDLNAKNYGVPQNRNRTFMVSLLDGYFTFPEPFELKERLRDRLETDVDESYFLSDAKVESIKQSTFGQRARRIHEDTAGGGH